MFLDRMNYLEVEEYLKKNDSIIIVTGSTENHGKHMPLGTDTMIPEKIAQLADEKLGDRIVIGPALPYGSTEDLKGFPGTLSIGPDLLTEVLNRICGQLYDYGFRHFIILNGHGGNTKSIERTGHYLYRRNARLAIVNWWLIAGQINPQWKGGHGGAEETAGVMAVDPTLIKTEYLHEGENFVNDLGDELPVSDWNAVKFKGGIITIPRPLKDVTDNGWNQYGMTTDFPYMATEERGREMVAAMADYVADFAEVFARVKMPQDGER